MEFRRRFFVVALLFLGNILPAVQFANGEEKKTAALIVDYGDGVRKHFKAIAWREGMTIADLLAAAVKHPRGITIKTKGSGATTMLLQIDSLANGTDERYWIFDVNDVPGDRSYALVKVMPGDVVLWRFDVYQ